MKKSLGILALVAAMVMSFTAHAADRSHTLKVYNWADYIDEDVLEQFPVWYKQQTGEDVYVIYKTFDINETMLMEVELGHDDYDVICPSEYIIERMLRNGLLQKIRKDFIPEDQQYFNNVSPFVLDKFQQMAPNDSLQVSDYTVGYMWGTTGWLYNPAFVSPDELKSWGAIANPRFKNHIFVKDAFRDVYSVMVLYCYREELERGEVTRDELVHNVTPERIARVEKLLTDSKENIAGWEVDFGKEEVTKGRCWLNISWSGDAQWAIDEGARVGLPLNYIVPEEGSNVWFDGWCIPLYALNTKAAAYFINYMCMPENAIKNMEFIGYVSAISSPEILEWANDDEIEETADLRYFFGPEAGAIHANQVMYPDQSVIDRCSLMHDCADQTEEMLAMWSRIKGDNLSSMMIILISVIVLGLVIFTISQAMHSKRQRKMLKKVKK